MKGENMSNDILKLQCPTCGATIVFDIGRELVVCEYCESEYPIEYFDDLIAQNDKKQDLDWRVESLKKEYKEMEAKEGLVCTSCGAEVINNGSTVATECMYCGNAIIIVDSIKGMLQPDGVLPFKIQREEAKNLLKKFYSKKILLPSEFTDLNRLNKITGVYVPFWLFSGKGVFNFTYEPNKVSTSREGGYLVTKTKHYELDVTGDIDYVELPANASSKMPSDYMDGLEPFDFNALSEFSPSYMASFYAEKFDVSVDECTEHIKDRVFFDVDSKADYAKWKYLQKKKVEPTTSKEKSHTYLLENENIQYVLLPVWMLNTKYKGRNYHYAINGQTGKVSGKLPIDRNKLMLLSLSVFMGVGTSISCLLYLIIILFGGMQ